MKLSHFVIVLLLISFPVHAGYDCYDGKHDDCTAKWSRDHAPRDKKELPTCQKKPCENGDSPVVETPKRISDCKSIDDEYGSNLSVNAGDRLKSLLPDGTSIYKSDCAMSSFIAGECRLHPNMSINQAIDSLVSKVNNGKKLPDIPRCGA
jgi:hypothetical protein